MKANIKWLDDPEVFRINQLPAHSDHPFYKDYREWQKHSSSFKQSLNGAWLIHFLIDPLCIPITMISGNGKITAAFLNKSSTVPVSFIIQKILKAGTLIFTNAALTHLPLTPTPFLVKLN